jgi:hypothetical protein
MTRLSLVVMAAGTGVRYGGLKQIEPVGPKGEALVEYAVFDALRAGLDRIVFVVRRDIVDAFVGAVGRKIQNRVPVEYVYQDDLEQLYQSATDGPPLRGTGLAVLSAASVLRESFVAINADDYYGPDAFRVLARHLRERDDDVAMVGYSVSNTLSDFGAVKRGLCRVTSDSMLESVTELDKVHFDGASVAYEDERGRQRRLRGDETVSMNMWGFRPHVLEGFRRKLEEFLANRSSVGRFSEFYIPSVVSDLIQEKACGCRVLRTESAWFGITHREDTEVARQNLCALVEKGVYPDDLWTVGVGSSRGFGFA